MGPRLGRKIALIQLIFAVIALGGCTQKGASEAESRAQRTEETLSLLDQRKYAQAISKLEEDYRKSRDPRDAVLLAEAHLGAAGIEAADLLRELERSPAPNEKLDLAANLTCGSPEQNKDYRCLAFKFIKKLPNPEDPHILAAKQILREQFPNPRDAEKSANILAAFVEFGSAVTRLKVLLNKAILKDAKEKSASSPEALPFELMIHHFKAMLDEFFQGIDRTRFSHKKVSKFVVQKDGKALIQVGEDRLDFNRALNAERILEFIAAVVKENAAALDRKATDLVADFPTSCARVLIAMDRKHFESQGALILEGLTQIQAAINRVLKSVTDDRGGSFVGVNLFQWLVDHPPGIVRDLTTAAKVAWEKENADQLRDYLRYRLADWKELFNLYQEWDRFGKSLSSEESHKLIHAMTLAYQKTPAGWVHPAEFSGGRLSDWQEDLIRNLEAVLSDPEAIAPSRTEEIKSLILRSKSWAEYNLWSHE